MPKILISYRRSDTAGVAGRIFDRLVAHFGHDSIFMDVDTIPFGTDFREHIRETLLAGDMLVAIVGPRWLGPRPEGRARMHDENDPVRVEIETALSQQLPLVPVLVDGAVMPTPDELPAALAKFSYLNAAPVDTGRDFHAHMDRLIRSMDRILEIKAGKPAAPVTQTSTVAALPPSDPSPRRWWAMAAGAASVLAVVAVFALRGMWMPEPGEIKKPMVPPSGAPIRIGFGIVLSGPAAPLGKEVLLAAKIWQEDTNAGGGLLGRPVELVYHDDEGSPSNVPGIYARLIDIDKADLVVSGWPGFLIAPAMPIVMQKSRLFLGLLGDGVNDEFRYPRYFSMAPTGPSRRGVFTRGVFDLAMAQNPRPRSVAISASDEEACKPVADGARGQAKAAGLPVVHDETYAYDTTDFAPIVRALAAANPDVVVTCAFGTDAGAFVRAVGEAGFKPKIIGGAMPSLRSVALKAELGPLLNGWLGVEFWLPAPKLQFEGVNGFLARYQARAQDEGADPLGYQLAPWSYARMQVMQQAVEAAQSLDDSRLADTLRTRSFKTVVGEVKFGDRGEWAQPRVLQVQFQNIRGNDAAQFGDLRTQLIVDPPAYKSGNLIYPFADARK